MPLIQEYVFSSLYKFTQQGKFRKVLNGNRHKSSRKPVIVCFQWELLLKTLQKDSVSQEKSKIWLRLVSYSLHFSHPISYY